MNFKKVTTGVLAGAMLASLTVVPTVAADEHHAYLQFQTSNYAYRNNFDEKDYGLNNAGGYDYSKVQGWTDSNEHSYREGTLTDVTFTGDGTYTVSLTGAEFWERDFNATAACPFNVLAVSTDLDINLLDPEANNGFELTVDKFTVDGKEYTVGDHQYNNYEDDGDYASVIVINSWADEEYKTFTGLEADSSIKEITLTFTVKGLSEEAGDVAPIAYLAALVAVAGIAMVASKKRA